MTQLREFGRRLEKALAWLEESGIRRSTYAPPMFRLLWKAGVRIPPPHMNGFVVNAFVMGGFFATAWGLIMWLTLWSWQGKPFVAVVATSLSAGALFGLIMAAYLVAQARHYQVPRWLTFTAD